MAWQVRSQHKDKALCMIISYNGTVQFKVQVQVMSASI